MCRTIRRRPAPLRHLGRLLLAARACLLIALGGFVASQTAALADAAFTPPPIQHVWIINIENVSYSQSFDSPDADPYLARVLTSQGVLLRQYYAIGHESLDNYIAQVSGQSPTPQTQEDCSPNTDFVDSGTDTNGQVIGQGCVYPFRVDTIGQQLEQRGRTWKGYMEDMGIRSGRLNHQIECAYIPIGGNDPGADPFNGYVAKHNPFVYFHKIIDDPPYCRAHDVPLTPLAHDLQRISTTPNFSYITPNTFNDQHDANLDQADRWLRQYVRMITASPAYRQDGMVIVTFDEAAGFGAEPTEDLACCNEIPGPNTPVPGISGPGGGRVGAVVLSPYVKPATVTDTPYNHYSLLRSLEDLFHVDTGGDDGRGHLGYAGTYTTYPGPGSFGPDVYTANRASTAGPAPTAPAGTPRGSDGSFAWASPSPQGNDLKSVACPTETDCVAVGDLGAVVSTSDGRTWTAQRPPTGEDLAGVSCPSVSDCIAVGGGGAILTTADAGRSWTGRSSGTSKALNEVSCPDTTTCVAVGDGGTIVVSVDGGASWTARDSGTQQGLNAVTCPSAARCIAVGEERTILRSGPNADNWSLQTTPDEPRRYFSVACTSQSDCLAVGDHPNWVLTSNGGSSWQASAGGDYIHPFGVGCADASTCLVGGTSNTFPAYGNGSPGFFAVSDVHGLLRTTSYSPRYATEDAARFDALNAVACPSASRCFGVGAHGEVIAVTNPPAGTWSQQRIGPARDLAGASCAAVTTCVVVGDSAPNCTTGCSGAVRTPATILATQDGESWTSHDPGTSERLNAVSCSAAAECVAVGDLGTVVRSQDGSSWAVVPDPTSVRGAATLLGVSCPAATTLCVAVGDHGTVLRSDDDGATWSSVQAGTEEFLNAVSCASATDCVAVGSTGTIIRSTDGGASWSSQSVPTTSPLLGVSCPSVQRCVAVGAGGNALVSGDGGQSWAPQQASHDGADLLAVSCASDADCEATGSEGTALTTSDGGAIWAPRGTGTARALAAVSCPVATSCYEAGERGAVLRPRRTGFARPKGATPLYVPLTPAFKPCASPNANHGAPLSYASCSPPQQASDYVTVGTPDSNQKAANMVGSVRYSVRAGDLSTPANEADVLLNVSITDVRKKSDLSDYTGQLQLNATVQITDRQNGPAADEPATVADLSFPITLPCAATADTAVGATCSLLSSFDAVLPGSVVEGKRAIWKLGQIEVDDGGPDGLASTSPNTVFAREGLFVP